MKTIKIDVEKIELEKDGETGEIPVNPFRGVVELLIPNVRERFDVVAKMNIDKNKKDEDNIEAGIKIFDMVSKQLTLVDIEHVETGIKITSPDELSYYEESTVLLRVFGHYLMNGVPVGKVSSAP